MTDNSQGVKVARCRLGLAARQTHAKTDRRQRVGERPRTLGGTIWLIGVSQPQFLEAFVCLCSCALALPVISYSSPALHPSELGEAYDSCTNMPETSGVLFLGELSTPPVGTRAGTF